MSRKQVLVYSLAAGVAAGLGLGAYLTRHRKQQAPPHLPLVLAENVAWANRSTIHRADGSGSTLLEGFVADGKRFRLEVAMEGKPAVVWVFDGTDLAANVKLPPKSPAQLDPRNTVLAAYDDFMTFRYLGVTRVGDHDCWAWEKNQGGLHSRFWVDVKTSAPRQIIVEYPDGRKDTQVYTDLPTYRTHQPGLFDASHLSPMLMPGVEAVLSDDAG